MDHLLNTRMFSFNDFFNLIYPGRTQHDNVKKAQQHFRSLLHLLQCSPAKLQQLFEDSDLVYQIELYKRVLMSVMHQPQEEVALSIKDLHIRLLVALSHSYYSVEYFKVFYLNADDAIIDCEVLHVGTPSHVPIDNKLILQRAQHFEACAVIVVHNHPSGNLKPSREDSQGAQQLKRFLEVHNVCLQQSYIYAQGQLRPILKLDFS